MVTPKQCVMCGHPLRPAQVPIAKAPGTRQHRAHGLCKACYYQEREAGNLPEPDTRRGRKRGPVVELTHMFDERAARTALDLWLNDRRRRLAGGAA